MVSCRNPERVISISTITVGTVLRWRASATAIIRGNGEETRKRHCSISRHRIDHLATTLIVLWLSYDRQVFALSHVDLID